MSLENVKQEAAALAPAERRHLMGFLVSLNLIDEDRAELARKIDDRNPANWLSLEQLDEKLQALDEVRGE